MQTVSLSRHKQNFIIFSGCSQVTILAVIYQNFLQIVSEIIHTIIT